MKEEKLKEKHESNATLEDNIKTLFELYHALEERSSALCTMIQQYHYWTPTEREVSLFNKAVTTNKTLTPAERAELDIIRMKFKRCNGIPQDKQKEVTEQDDFSFGEQEQVIHRSFLCAGVENVPVGIIKDTAKECLEAINPEGGSSEIPNNQWSDEDEVAVTSIIDVLKRFEHRGATDIKIDWLNSLPERFK